MGLEIGEERGCERVGLEGERGCARVGGREGFERVRLEEEKGCEGKVEWGWRKGRGVRERWSGVGGCRVGGRTTRIELKIWTNSQELC